MNPILNVSNIPESVAWFEKLGLFKGFEWGDPPTFGSVYRDDNEIFLCQGGQGSRGKGSNKMTFGPEGDETGDKGVWMSIWIENVDAAYQHCVSQELEVAWPPTNMPWGVREMHVRHPDGHVFRLSQAIEEGPE